ncbi:conjugal transfer protein [Streptococcus timonensis]|jgi:membrane protein|uniref:conjugal transfer protein n=1 Tax=Streptococcus timonensis TaxID=1852387 RepID=UPI0039C34257
MQEAFDKLKGVDIFSLKSYMEPTGYASFNGAWVLINELFVNLFFFILNAVVGFFSLFIRILESIDLYSSYKTYVFNGAKSLWNGFTGSTKGNVTDQSLVALLLLILGFYLFYQYFFSKGSFAKTLLHVCLVILLGFGYFGTIARTSGGLYLLDTINNVSKDVKQKIVSIKVDYAKDKSVKVGESMSDSYIAETSYKAYLFVNTGQENGKYKNSQNGKEEDFDDSKVLGTSDSKGHFTAVKTKERSQYLDELGNGANEDGEKNRWVSAMPDFIFIRTFYVIFKVLEAFVLALPIIVIQLLNIIAQIIVLTMILIFPIVLLISFIPRMQELIFGVLKVMLGGLAFPIISSLLILLIFYIEKIVENMIITSFDTILKNLPSLVLLGLVFKLLVSVVAKGVIYFLIWKYKAELIQFILGSKARLVTSDIGNKIESGVIKTKEITSQIPTQSLKTAQHLGNFTLAGAGFASGMVMNSKSHFQNIGSYFTQKDTTSPIENSQSKPTENPISPNPSEITDPQIEIIHKNTQKPAVHSTNQQTATPTSNDEFQTLKEERISPFKQHRINNIEQQLEKYKDTQSMYKAQGSNAFTRAYRKTMTRDNKLKANIERRNRLTQRLNQLRGELNEH